jgi:hypothetical protein
MSRQTRDQKLARLRELRREFDAKRAELREVVAETRAAAEQARKDYRPLTAQDMRRLEDAARSGEAGADVRALQERIDRGEFTWPELLGGNAPDDAVEVWQARVAPLRDVAAAADDDVTVERFLRDLDRRGRGFEVPGGP